MQYPFMGIAYRGWANKIRIEQQHSMARISEITLRLLCCWEPCGWTRQRSSASGKYHRMEIRFGIHFCMNPPYVRENWLWNYIIIIIIKYNTVEIGEFRKYKQIILFFKIETDGDHLENHRRIAKVYPIWTAKDILG